jgi:signal transduction histidine kinase
MSVPRWPGDRSPGLSDILRAVVNSLPIVVYAMASDGTVLLAEGRALEWLGSAPGWSVGRDIREAFAAEPETLDHIDRALHGESHDAKVTLAGNGRTYHVWFVPSTDRQGRVLMVTGLSLDVTAAEAEHRQLEDATYWLERLLETLPVAVFAVTGAGMVSMARGTALPEAIREGVGRPIDQAEVPAKTVEAVRRALAGEDMTFTTADDRELSWSVRPLLESGRVDGAIGVVVEIIDGMRLEAAQAENERKNRFLANMSHEMRTPLTSILGFCQLLGSEQFGPLNERQRRYVQHIHTGGAHLLNLINDLLDVSRVQAGELRLVFEAVEPGEVVDVVIQQMAEEARGRGLELVRGPQTAATAVGDRGRLLQVLLNLVANAIKFTPAPGRVEISSIRTGRFVRFDVVDTGIGLSPADQELVFGEFYQVVDPEGRHLEGTGLGLALSRELARAMSGDVEVHSELGKGSTFSVHVPVRRS